MSIRELWKQADSELSNALTQALVAAFAYVAAADGEAHADELDRFRGFLADSPLDPAARDAMIASYGETTAAFSDDFEAAKTAAHAHIGAAPESARALVLAAARAGVVADSRIDDREEVVIREISELLGLDPDDA